MKNTYLLDG